MGSNCENENYNLVVWLLAFNLMDIFVAKTIDRMHESVLENVNSLKWLIKKNKRSECIADAEEIPKD